MLRELAVQLPPDGVSTPLSRAPIELGDSPAPRDEGTGVQSAPARVLPTVPRMSTFHSRSDSVVGRNVNSLRRKGRSSFTGVIFSPLVTDQLCPPIGGEGSASLLPKSAEETRCNANAKHLVMLETLSEVTTSLHTMAALQGQHSLAYCTAVIEESVLELGVDKTYLLLHELRKVKSDLERGCKKVEQLHDVMQQEMTVLRELFAQMGPAFVALHNAKSAAEEELRTMAASWDRKDVALDRAISYVHAVVQERTAWQLQKQKQSATRPAPLAAPTGTAPVSQHHNNIGSALEISGESQLGGLPQISTTVSQGSVVAVDRGHGAKGGVTAGPSPLVMASQQHFPGSAADLGGVSYGNRALFLPVVSEDFISISSGALAALYDASAIAKSSRTGSGRFRPTVADPFPGAAASSGTSGKHLPVVRGTSTGQGTAEDCNGRLRCDAAALAPSVLGSSSLVERWQRKAQMQYLSVTPAARVRYVPPLEELQILRDTLAMGTAPTMLLADVNNAKRQLKNGRLRVREQLNHVSQSAKQLRLRLSEMRKWLLGLRELGMPFMAQREELLRLIRLFVERANRPPSPEGQLVANLSEVEWQRRVNSSGGEVPVTNGAWSHYADSSRRGDGGEVERLSLASRVHFTPSAENAASESCERALKSPEA